MANLPSHFTVFREAKQGAHLEAGKELLAVTAVSAIPFAIGAVAYILLNEMRAGSADIGLYLSTVFLRGQLFLVAVSYMANALHRLWNSHHSYERPDIINFVSMLLFGVIGVFYGLNPEFAELSSGFSTLMSVFFFLSSLLFYYYTAVLAYHRPKEMADALKADVDDLGAKLNIRREEQAGQQ